MRSRTNPRDFPGGPVVKTPFSQGRGHGFDPQSGNQDPTCCMVQPKKRKKKEQIPVRFFWATRKMRDPRVG